MVTVKVDSPVNARIRVNKEGGTAGTTQTLTFSTTEWNRAQTVTVTAIDDANAIGGKATIKHTTSSDDINYNKISVRSVEITELDSVSTVSLSLSATSVQEGKMVTITATLGNSDADDDTPATLSSPVAVTLSRESSSTAEKSGRLQGVRHHDRGEQHRRLLHAGGSARRG